MAYPPGPALPAFAQSLLWLARPVAVMESCRDRYGDAFTLRWIGTGRIVFISDPDLIRQIFTGDPSVLLGGAGNAIVEPLLGKASLFVLDGAPHLRERRLLMPPFHGERMQKYATVMRDITDRAIDRWPQGRTFSLHEEMQRITLEVIARTVFGVDQREHLEHLLEVLQDLIDYVGSRSSDLFTLLPSREAQRLVQVDLGPWSPWGRFLRLKRAVDDAIYAEIERRRTTKKTDESMLSLLLEARDEDGRAMEDGELRDELMTFLIAGHETTAGGLAWAFENILSHPPILARVDEELAGAEGVIDGARLAKMPYIDAAMKEALRLRPILQIVARKLATPLRVGDWDLEAGAVVAPCIYLSHRRAASFADPERFDPERFLGEKANPYKFFPFGGGIRRCIGAAFALYQMKVVTATILSRARLRLASRSTTVTRRTVTLVPALGTKVVLERRSPRSRPN